MGRRIDIFLEEDNLTFLEAMHPGATTRDLSSYINSLLRQEQFRHGWQPGRQRLLPLRNSPSWAGFVSDTARSRSGWPARP